MYWLSFLASLIPLGWAVQLVRELVLAQRLARIGMEVEGRIIRQRKVRGDRRIYWVPVIRFTTRAGEVVKGESAGHTIGLHFHNGHTVRLCYDPAQPARFFLVSELSSTSRYVRLGIAGLMLAFLWLH